MFLTNSLMEIMPLASIDDVKIGCNVPGDITFQLLGAYREATQTSL